MSYIAKCISTKALFVVVFITVICFLLQYDTISYKIIKKIDDYRQKSKCEVIHIGIVSGGYKTNVYFHNMLKSLYFYRKNPLHFHLLTDEKSEHVLKTLFQTWAVPEVNVSFYKIHDYQDDVNWIQTNHYAGIYGLLKLIFPTIIPLTLTTKIMILDTDLTLMGDIYDLWKLFDQFSNNQAVGMVENQSNYYLGKLSIKHPWPAIGKGFNSGVILYHLKYLKSIDWTTLWTRITRNTTSTHGKVQLGDQDVLNALLKAEPNLVYNLPCQWNIQLSFFTQSKDCLRSNSIKIVHWNSHDKYTAYNNENGPFFREVHSSFNKFDGSLFRTRLSECGNDSSVTTDIPFSTECEYFAEPKIYTRKWRTMLFFMDFKYEIAENDITLVTQMLYDDLHSIEMLSKQWNGPISVTLYITDIELQNCMNFIGHSKILKKRSNIAYHAVFKEGSFEPINLLRNTGLRNVNTKYVFLLDTGFLLKENLYSILKMHVEEMVDMKKKALIVPVFQSQNKSGMFPKSNENLTNNEILLPHAVINYTRWKPAETSYKMRGQPNLQPFILVLRNVTNYDERLLDMELGKLSHIMELEAQGYEFIVLPNATVMSQSKANSKKQKSNTNTCLKTLEEQIRLELNVKYRS